MFFRFRSMIFGVWVILFALFPAVASAADSPTLGTAILAQLPATIMALTVFIPALGATWLSLRSKVAEVQKTADATHSMINSRLDEWKNETKLAAIAAAVAAHDAGLRAGLAQATAKSDAVLEGYLKGRAEAERQAREVAQALATPPAHPDTSTATIREPKPSA
jgi:hypothetical protein